MPFTLKRLTAIGEDEDVEQNESKEKEEEKVEEEKEEEVEEKTKEGEEKMEEEKEEGYDYDDGTNDTLGLEDPIDSGRGTVCSS